MKKLFLKITIIATIISIIATNSNAQDNKIVVPAPIQNLMKFLGRWDADATFIIEGKTYKVVHSLNGKKTADGNGLSIDESFTHPELGSLKGANLVGFNPYDSKIHWFSVDNMGTTHEHIGEWLTPDHLYIEHNGIRDGKNFVEKIDLTFKGKDQMDLKLVATLDGKEIERAEGIYHRKVATVKK